MKHNTRYTSAVTNQPFLFQETLTVARDLQQGKTWQDIKTRIEVDNVLNYPAKATRKNVFQGISARLKTADMRLITLLLDSPLASAKLVNFFLCLRHFRLLRELMAEAVLPQIQRGNRELTAFEVNEFFAHKRMTQDTLHRWQDSTFERVKSNTLRLATDAEVLTGPPQGPWQIQRPLMPLELSQLLRALDAAAYIPLIGQEI